MNKLLNAGLVRLFHNRLFRTGMLLSVSFGILMNLIRYLDIQKNPEAYAKLGAEYHSAEGFVFSGAIYIMFLIAVIVAKLLGTEYSDGTLRNKIIAGHKREAIFLANYGIGAVASLCMLLAFIVVTLIVGRALLPATCLTTRELVSFVLSECASMLALTAIFVMITMLVRSKSTAIATCLILTVVFFAAGMTISSKLSEAQGIKRAVYEQLNNILPVNQVLQVMMFEKEHLVIMAVYSVLLIALCNGTGIWVFRKIDLK